MQFEHEDLAGPLKPDDFQIHASTNDKDRVPGLLAEVASRAIADEPTRAFHGWRLEIVHDGDGQPFYNLTVYLRSIQPTDTLDPRNLNGTEQAVFGQYMEPDDLQRLNVGQKESSLRGLH